MKQIDADKTNTVVSRIYRIRTLTGREIELDVEPTDKVSPSLPFSVSLYLLVELESLDIGKLTALYRTGCTDQGEG